MTRATKLATRVMSEEDQRQFGERLYRQPGRVGERGVELEDDSRGDR